MIRSRQILRLPKGKTGKRFTPVRFRTAIYRVVLTASKRNRGRGEQVLVNRSGSRNPVTKDDLTLAVGKKLPQISMTCYVSRDKNHKTIVDELEKRGVNTVDLSAAGFGLSDIVTYFRGQTVFIEIKVVGKTAELKRSQIEFLGKWRGFCGVARDAEEAFRIATEPQFHTLTDRQKEKLLAYHHTMKGKRVSLNTILKLIA